MDGITCRLSADRLFFARRAPGERLPTYWL
jgi:hypothetical protein